MSHSSSCRSRDRIGCHPRELVRVDRPTALASLVLVAIGAALSTASTHAPRRRRGLAAECALLSLIVAASPIEGATALASYAEGIDVDTIHVAPPTGKRDADRASIVAAFERARPGSTIQFASGIYLVGDLIRLDTPRLTLLGHADGTTLRGCELEAYEEMERRAAMAFQEEGLDADLTVFDRCGTFQLTGGHVAVRGFTFEQTRLGLVLGCCESDNVVHPLPGGYLIEGNTFRNTGNSIRAGLSSPEPTVIRGNAFVNAFHALSAAGSHIHFVDNRVSVPEPERIPVEGHPGFGVAISSIPPSPGNLAEPPAGRCAENVIAGNHVEGHPDAILLLAIAGTVCGGNVIRENTLVVRRARRPGDWRYEELFPLADPTDSTFVGVPLTLWGMSDEDTPWGLWEEAGRPGVLSGNRIEGNRILGAEGLAIQLLHAPDNRIADNTISGIRIRDPFPGNAPGTTSLWEEANGSAIWASPGSDGNEIRGNTFEDVEAYAVVLESDGNHVETLHPTDTVRDRGVGNRVTGPGGVTAAGTPAEVVSQESVENPAASGFVDAEGARIHFLDHGGAGPPLVFLPGLGHNAHLFDDFAPRFTDGHRVVAITRRGHAPSTGSEAEFDLDTLIRDILTVLDTLGIERAAFVGHSYGGFEMTRLAGDFPERVDRLIYLDAAHDYVAFLDPVFDRCPPPPPMTATDSASWETVAAFQSSQTRVDWSESVVRSYYTFGADGRLRSGVVDPEFAMRLISVEESPRYDRLEAPALAIYHVPAVPWSEPSALHWYHALGDDQQVTGECLAALEDFVDGSIRQFSDQARQGQVIRIPDGTHYPFLARPDLVERAMRAFLMADGLSESEG
jgi:non-heme chloroperoxidase